MARLERCTERRTGRAAKHVMLAVLLGALGIAVAHAEYRVPRLENDRPDLQGSWDHNDATPLERMPGFSLLVITKEQAKKIEAMLEATFEDRTTPTEPTEFFHERRILPIRGELRSSIVVDPADGKLPWSPAFADWPVKARRGILAAMDGPEQRPTSERCLGNPASQPPHLYNPGTNLHQIIQMKDTVLFISEWVHEARIIRMNSKHVPPAITSWLGDSIGWWEGDTLVVETTNFTASDSGRIASPNAFRISSRAKVIERFTRVSREELNYMFTVEDTESYTQLWKGETHFIRTDDRVLEYSCHEDNRSMMYILQGARAMEKRAMDKAAQGGQVTEER